MQEICFRQENVELAFVFGSVAKQQSRTGSDIDIALLLQDLPSDEKRLELRTHLSGELSELLGQEADVVLLNTAGSILKYQVARDGQLIFERHKGQAKIFRLKTIKEYFDYLPIFNFHYERLAKESH
jgi:uncharacterized protein